MIKNMKKKFLIFLLRGFSREQVSFAAEFPRFDKLNYIFYTLKFTQKIF